MVRNILILSILTLVGLALFARSTRVNYYSNTVTIGAGVSDTITIPTYLTFDADSIGLALQVNQDSISGYVRYNYVSPSGYTDTTTIPYMSEVITLLTQEYANFSDAITQKGGSDQAIVHLILTNDSYQSKTIQYQLYKTKWN